MVGDGEGGDADQSGAAEELGWGEEAVGGGGVGVEVNLARLRIADCGLRIGSKSHGTVYQKGFGISA